MIDRWPLRLALASIARPRLAVAALLAVTLAAAPGLARLTLRTDGHALVPPEDPAVVFDAEVRRHFDLRDPIVVLIETTHPDGIYNPETMRRVAELTQALAALPEIGERWVMSLATEHRDRVYPGTLKFRPYLDPLPETPEQMATLRGDIAAADLLTGTLVSADGTATAIHVGAPSSTGTARDRVDRTALYRKIVAAAKPFETETDRIRVVGAPVAESLLGTHILEDLTVLVPLALAVIALVVWIGCRRFWGVALALGEVGACLVFTFGLMGWLGVPVYLTTAVLPVILTTLGLADEIHIFWHYQRRLERPVGGASAAHPETVRTTMKEMARPVVLTSVTTSLAFLSFLASSIEPVRRFGLFAAVGILYCLLWSLTVTPASLALLSPEKLRRRRARPSPAASTPGENPPSIPPLPKGGSLFSAFLAHRRATLAVLALLTVALGAGALRLYVQDSWIDGFAPGSAFRQDTDRVDALLHGTHELLVHLDFRQVPPERVPEGRNRSGPLLSPEILRTIEAFEEHLGREPRVGGVLGPASHLKTVAYLWLGRQEQNRKIPDEPQRIDLLLNRFDMGRGVDRRREVIDDALSRAVVTIFLKDANYRDTAVLMDDIRAWAQEHLEPLGATVGFAGDVAVSQAMIPAIVQTQVSSLLLALVGAFLAVCLLTRSLTTGLLAVLPVSAAVLWVFGAMGWAGIPLGVATSMFCAITLGIGVDYAIHFLESRRRRREAGEARPVEAAVAEAGPAIVTDAAAIALGFGLLAVSQVPANARLGLLVAVALASAALLTLAGLGALLAEPDVL